MLVVYWINWIEMFKVTFVIKELWNIPIKIGVKRNYKFMLFLQTNYRLYWNILVKKYAK